MMLKPVEQLTTSNGCFVLGKEGPSFNRYITKYRLARCSRVSQTTQDNGNSCGASGPSASSAAEDDVDHCCHRRQTPAAEIHGGAGRAEWLEEFCLCVLHVLVIVLGAVDACLELRVKVHGGTAAHAHLILCTAATLLATLQMAGRVMSLRTSGRLNLVASDMLTSPDDNEAVSSLMSAFATWKRRFTAFGVCAIVVNILLLSVFYIVVHLGWTLLSNNIFVIVVNFFHRSVANSIQHEIKQSNEDAHKLVLFEALLLLQERSTMKSSFTSSPAPTSRSSNSSTITSSSTLDRRRTHMMVVDQFLAAVRNTRCYRKWDSSGRIERINPCHFNSRTAANATDFAESSLIRINEEHLSCV